MSFVIDIKSVYRFVLVQSRNSRPLLGEPFFWFLTTAAPRNTFFKQRHVSHQQGELYLCGLVATCCNLHPLPPSNSHALLCTFMYFPSYSACSSYSLQFVSLWVWGPESSVWLLGFVDIRSGVALLGSVAQRSLFRWIPLTSLTWNWIALVLRFACRIETLPGPHRRVLFKTGAICRQLFRHQSDPGKIWNFTTVDPKTFAQIAHDILETSPEQGHGIPDQLEDKRKTRTGDKRKRERQNQGGGHSIPAKADTLKTALRTSTVNCLGKKVKVRHNKAIRSPEKCTERVFVLHSAISSASR